MVKCSDDLQHFQIIWLAWLTCEHFAIIIGVETRQTTWLSLVAGHSYLPGHRRQFEVLMNGSNQELQCLIFTFAPWHDQGSYRTRSRERVRSVETKWKWCRSNDYTRHHVCTTKLGTQYTPDMFKFNKPDSAFEINVNRFRALNSFMVYSWAVLKARQEAKLKDRDCKSGCQNAYMVQIKSVRL